MSELYTGGEVRSTFETFRGYQRDMIEASFDHFQTKLRLFVNFCEKDDVFRVVTRFLHLRVGDVREWYFRAADAGGSKEMPAEPADWLATVYKLLLELKQQRLDLRNLLSSLFSARSLPEAFSDFKTRWLERYQREMNERLAAVERRIPEDVGAKVPLEDVVAEAFGAAAPPMPGEIAPAPAPPSPAGPPAAAFIATAPAADSKAHLPEASAPAAAGALIPGAPGAPGAEAGEARGPAADAADAPGLEDLVAAFEAAVKATKGLASAVKGDLKADVKILKLEIARRAPRREVILAVARPLERLAGKLKEVGEAIVRRAEREAP